MAEAAAGRRPAPPWMHRTGRVLGSTWLLAALIALFSWHALPVVPGAGLDSSWVTALNMAADVRLDFGTQVLFTFGPLGFLDQPQASFAVTAVLGAVYQVLVAWGLAFSLLWAARRSFPLALALALAFVVSTLLFRGEELVQIAFIWCAVALAPDPPRFARPLVVYGGAIVSATQLLLKLNVGVTVLLLCAIAVLALQGDPRRNALAFVGTFVGALAVLWFATGQGVGNFDDYVTGAVAVASGHSEAMGVESPSVPWDKLAVALEAIAAIVAAAYVGLRLPRFRLAALVAITAIYVYAEFKSGLVRNDAAHHGRFFSAMLVPWLALPWRGQARGVALAAIVAIAVVFIPAAGTRFRDVFTPLDRADAAGTQLRGLLDPGRRSKLVGFDRFGLAIFYRLDQGSLALLRGHGVAVDPWEVSLVWAYGLDWHPLPVFQRYLAYTSELDRRNAEALASDHGPERIIRSRPSYDPSGPTTASIDSRYGPFEAPSQTLAMLCNYRPLRTTPRYQVLGKSRDRCDEPIPLRSTVARYGDTVAVPRAPGRLVVATVDGLEPQGVERLRTLLYRSAFRFVNVDGTTYRMVPGTADDLGLVLRAPAAVDFPRPFAVAPQARTMQFVKASNTLSPDGELRIRFYAIRAAPFSRAPARARTARQARRPAGRAGSAG